MVPGPVRLWGIDCGSDNADLEPEVCHSLPASQFPFSRALRGTSARPGALAPLRFHLPHVFTCTQLFPVYLVLPKKPRVDSFIGNWPSNESEARGIAVSFTTRSEDKEEKEGKEKDSGERNLVGQLPGFHRAQAGPSRVLCLTNWYSAVCNGERPRSFTQPLGWCMFLGREVNMVVSPL